MQEEQKGEEVACLQMSLKVESKEHWKGIQHIVKIMSFFKSVMQNFLYYYMSNQKLFASHLRKWSSLILGARKGLSKAPSYSMLSHP